METTHRMQLPERYAEALDKVDERIVILQDKIRAARTTREKILEKINRL